MKSDNMTIVAVGLHRLYSSCLILLCFMFLHHSGLDRLTNVKRGDYYGVATTWFARDKRKVGVCLLKKALQIFMGEGERQISPPDVDGKYHAY